MSLFLVFGLAFSDRGDIYWAKKRQPKSAQYNPVRGGPGTSTEANWQGFFSRFFADSCKCTFRFLEFFEKICLSFSKILEFFEEMRVFRGKCEFFEENAWVFYYFWVELSDFLSFLLEFLRKIPWVWVFFPLSFFQNVEKKALTYTLILQTVEETGDQSQFTIFLHQRMFNDKDCTNSILKHYTLF